VTTQPTFTGTPDDWWENAEPITHAEAQERNMGDWYIARVTSRTWDGSESRARYTISTPSKLPNREKADAAYGSQGIAERVRRLIHMPEEVPAWKLAEMVTAEVPGKGPERHPWMRNANGRWRLLSDARINVNDASMAELNPRPAVVVETQDLV